MYQILLLPLHSSSSFQIQKVTVFQFSPVLVLYPYIRLTWLPFPLRDMWDYLLQSPSVAGKAHLNSSHKAWLTGYPWELVPALQSAMKSLTLLKSFQSSCGVLLASRSGGGEFSLPEMFYLKFRKSFWQFHIIAFQMAQGRIEPIRC